MQHSVTHSARSVSCETHYPVSLRSHAVRAAISRSLLNFAYRKQPQRNSITQRRRDAQALAAAMEAFFYSPVRSPASSASESELPPGERQAAGGSHQEGPCHHS